MEQMIELDESYLPEMAELYKTAFGGDPWHDDWSDRNQLMEYMREISSCYRALNYGLLIDGRLVAFSVGMIRHWWEGANYNIEEFCVTPDLQGQGIGSQIFADIRASLEAQFQNSALSWVWKFKYDEPGETAATTA